MASPKTSSFVATVVFVSITISVGTYVASAIYRGLPERIILPHPMTLASAFILFGVLLAGASVAMKAIRSLLIVMLMWFAVISSWTFFSIPSGQTTMITGIVLEAIAVALYALSVRSGKNLG